MRNIKTFDALFEEEKGGFLMSKTYQVVTPESAEDGSYADQGMEYENTKFETLLDLAQEIRDNGATEPSSSKVDKHTWYSTPDGDHNFVNGSTTYYSFHPKLNSNEEAQELFDLVKMDYNKFKQLHESNEERGYRLWKYDIKNKKAIPVTTGVMHEVGIEGFYFSKPDKDGMLDGNFDLSDTEEEVTEDALRRLKKLGI